MEILYNIINNVHVVYPSGRFDSKSAPEVQEQLDAVFSQGGTRIIINMADVDFVDSTALTTLVRAQRMAGAKGGDLVLCELQQPARIIFELTRLDTVFHIFSDEQAALAAFKAGESG